MSFCVYLEKQPGRKRTLQFLDSRTGCVYAEGDQQRGEYIQQRWGKKRKIFQEKNKLDVKKKIYK